MLKMELEAFVFNEQNVQTIEDEDKKVWFVGKEIANILWYADTDQAIRDHVDDEDKKLPLSFRRGSLDAEYWSTNRGCIG